MQALLSRRACSGANARVRSSGARGCKRVVHARPSAAPRQHAVQAKAFFSFLQPKPAAPLVDPRAKPLVEELIALTSGTDAGAKASPQLKEEIAAVVTELSRYAPKNPLKSDLLFGEWKVLFASKPTAVGGPLRSGAGPAVFPGQSARQILTAPNKLVNVVEYKTLGFLPGSSRQYGEFTPISGDTFILNITSGEIAAGLGGPQKRDFNIQRKIQILYLDDELRVALFLPSELPDSEAAESGGGSEEDIVFVFQRIPSSAQPEAAEEEPEDGGEVVVEAPRPAFAFGGPRKADGAATVAERQVRQQLSQQRGGSAKVAVAAAPAKAAGGSLKVAVPRLGTQQRSKAPEPAEDPREKRKQEEERARKAKAAEAEAKAAEAKAAKERAEAERRAEREKQAAIKELLASLSDEIKARQAATREAAAALKDTEKAASAGLKQAAAAQAQVGEAEGDVKAISEQLLAAAAAKKEAEAAAKAGKDLVVAAEKALRAAVSAALPARK